MHKRIKEGQPQQVEQLYLYGGVYKHHVHQEQWALRAAVREYIQVIPQNHLSIRVDTHVWVKKQMSHK